jgi:hypothetical protein
LRRRARRPGLKTRCARTVGPVIPGERAVAAAAAKSAIASPFAYSVVVWEKKVSRCGTAVYLGGVLEIG